MSGIPPHASICQPKGLQQIPIPHQPPVSAWLTAFWLDCTDVYAALCSIILDSVHCTVLVLTLDSAHLSCSHRHFEHASNKAFWLLVRMKWFCHMLSLFFHFSAQYFKATSPIKVIHTKRDNYATMLVHFGEKSPAATQHLNDEEFRPACPC